jgi:ferredoxin
LCPILQSKVSPFLPARLWQNAPGPMYVDDTCIDCDTCRWMCPEVFTAAGGKSAVYHQPSHEGEKRSAFRAMVSCPTGSIRTEKGDMLLADVIEHEFPLAIDPQGLPGVYHLGYAPSLRGPPCGVHGEVLVVPCRKRL